MDEDLKLYIPLGVKPEAELFTGFGKKQLFQALIGSLVMGGVAALVRQPHHAVDKPCHGTHAHQQDDGL